MLTSMLSADVHAVPCMGCTQETYNYYYLPFCKHKPNQKDEHAWGGLGEVLQGNELINSQLDIKFKGMLHAEGSISQQHLKHANAQQAAHQS